MSGLPYQGGMNNYMFDMSQYGVNMPSQSSTPTGLNLGSLVSSLGGSAIGAGLNFASQMMQNRQQEYFYNQYMSPSARMAQMQAAGINPNLAAQGISGASAPQMTAAAPTNAYTGIGEQLGNSVNNALTASAIKAEINKTNAETKLTESLNVEKTTTNKYLDHMQQATLENLVNQGTISKHQANIIAVDDYYKGAEAAAHLEQTYLAIDKMAAELKNAEQEYFNLLAQEYATMMAGDLSKAQINKVFSDIGLNNAMIERIAHEVDNLDASTMATMQSISESQSRERVNRVAAQYQEKVLSVWTNSDFDMNSDVNSNFQRLCMEGKIDQAKTLLQGTEAMILNQGEARFHSKDYNMDKLIDVVGFATRLGSASILSSGVRDRGVTLQAPTLTQVKGFTREANNVGNNPIQSFKY